VTRMEQFIPGFNTDSHLQQNKKTIVKAPWHCRLPHTNHKKARTGFS
jgi:hypothetical protein